MKLNKISRLGVLLPAVIVGIGGALCGQAGVVTFSNTNTIIINDSENPPTLATPYPSSIAVTGLSGLVVSKITVQLFGITHSFPDDIDIVLQAPTGQNTVLMANCGSEIKTPVTNIDLTLDDDAATNLPLDSALVSGTFKPTRRLSSFTFDFPAPAPAQPDGAALSNFDNIEPNGMWKLFVVDDAAGDAGVITGGWVLNIATTPVLLSIARADTNAVLSWTNTLSGYALQASSSIGSGSWTNVMGTPATVSGCYIITNPVTGPAAFYRLAK